MHLTFPLFNVGLEVEFFIRNNNAIENASVLMRNSLGFSIDGNDSDRIAGSIQMGDGWSLHTDHTAMELHWYNPTGNHFAIPAAPMVNVMRIPGIAGKDFLFTDFIEVGKTTYFYEGQPLTFNDINSAYSSGKATRNAYSGLEWFPEKKDDGAIKFRTGGLHLHFSVRPESVGGEENAKLISEKIFQHRVPSKKANYKLADSLIKEMDNIWALMNGGITQGQRERITRYQHLGDYRIKLNTTSGLPTLEYRQFGSHDYYRKDRIERMVDVFQFQALKILKDIKI